jgi:two-component system response regulator RegA
MPEVAGTVLLVDDDAVFRQRLARAFGDRGWSVREAADADETRAALTGGAPEFAVVDLRLPDGSGLELVRAILGARPDARVVVLTGYGSIATALEAVRLGARHYLTKPATLNDILAGFARGKEPADTPAAAGNEVPSLARVEWEHINRVLQDSGGNVSEAARRLGMHRRSLQRKLAKFPTRR